MQRGGYDILQNVVAQSHPGGEVCPKPRKGRGKDGDCIGGDWAFTAKGGAVYATRLWGDDNYGSRFHACPVESPEKVRKVIHLATSREIAFKVENGKVTFTTPADIEPDWNAETFKVLFRSE